MPRAAKMPAPTTCNLCDYMRGKKPHARDCPNRPEFKGVRYQIPEDQRPGTRRSGAILVLLTPEEHERLRTAAAAVGLGLGPWLRSLGMREAAR